MHDFIPATRSSSSYLISMASWETPFYQLTEGGKMGPTYTYSHWCYNTSYNDKEGKSTL